MNNITEIWKDIKNYEGYYQVSNLGRVKSLDRLVHYTNGKKRFFKGLILKEMTQKSGYNTVNLYLKGMKYRFNHQLVAEAFLNHNSNRMMHIDHINEIKTDNRLCNLRIISSRENTTRNRDNKTSMYAGVFFSKNRKGTKKWSSKININKKQIDLGYFYSEIEAHKAYCLKLKQIKNDNFIN